MDNASRIRDNSPPPAACSDEKSSPNGSLGPQSGSFDIHFSDIKTPELISTPLSSSNITNPDCEPMESNVSVAGSGNRGCLNSDSILEEGSSPHLESKFSFDATPSNSSLDIHFSAIETPEMFGTSVASHGEHNSSIADAADHTDFCESGSENNDADDELEKCKSLEISETTSEPTAAADEHNDSTDCIDLHDSSSSDDDADDKLEQSKSQRLYSVISCSRYLYNM